MSPLISIVTSITLNKTGPAVFALLVLRTIRVPKGVLSRSIPLFHSTMSQFVISDMVDGFSRIDLKILRNAFILHSIRIPGLTVRTESCF